MDQTPGWQTALYLLSALVTIVVGIFGVINPLIQDRRKKVINSRAIVAKPFLDQAHCFHLDGLRQKASGDVGGAQAHLIDALCIYTEAGDTRFTPIVIRDLDDLEKLGISGTPTKPRAKGRVVELKPIDEQPTLRLRLRKG